MRIAVIGAGIVGVTTAWELARDGHEVSVFERRGSVAAEASFANGGFVGPGCAAPWVTPKLPSQLLRQLFSRHPAARFGGWPAGALMGWLWRWRRACDPATSEANRARVVRLARYSQARLHAITEDLGLDYEQACGSLVLMRSARDLALAAPTLAALEALDIPFALADPAACHRLEPGLDAEQPLHAAIHLPQDEIGNCRQFAHLLKGHAQRLGVRFHFHREVLGLTSGARPQLRHVSRAPQSSTLADSGAPSSPDDPASTLPVEEGFDAVVVCAALASAALLAPLGLKLPVAPVQGYSITAPLRTREGHHGIGPRAGVVDDRYKVAISRLGQRVRVAGCLELGGDPQKVSESAVATLYKVLHDWFPGAAQLAQAQRWKGARPMLPDGPPVLGASGAPGVWLNLGHGDAGWALASGCARALADLVASRPAAVDLEGLGPERLR